MNQRGLSAYLGRPAWAQPYKTKGIDRYVTGEPLPEKPVTMAIGEVAEGKYVSDPVIEEDEA